MPHARADFQILTFNEHLGDNQSDINTDFPFEGQTSSVKTFHIATEPFSSGFVQYMVKHVEDLSHQILINGKELPWIDVHRTGTGRNTGLQTHTDPIPASFLKHGDNTIQFRRVGNDNFIIYHVIVHWRETEP